MIKPHVITLAETKLHNIPPQLTNYTWITRNRPHKEGGGVAILIRNDITQKTSTITNLEDQDQEILWIQIKLNKKPINIGVFYGPQENTLSDETERQYSQLASQIHKLKKKGEVILTGDFNAKLQINTPPINQNESRNGKLLKDLLKNTELNPVSIENIYINWTREHRKKHNEKSTIDYILMTKNIANQVENIQIDSNHIYTLKGKEETDHNTIIVKTNITTNTQNNKTTIWNLNNKTGWKNFNTVLTKRLKNLVNPTYDQIEKATLNTMSETVGKITIDKTNIYYPRDPTTKQLRREVKYYRQKVKQTKLTTEDNQTKQELFDKYIQTQKTLKNHLELIQKKNIENKIKETILQTQKNPNHLWKLKKKLTSNNNNATNQTLITEDGRSVENPQEAKNYIANYFENLYKAREGNQSYQHWTDHIKDTVRTITKSTPKGHNPNHNIKFEELLKAIKALKAKKASGPDNIPNETLINANKYIRQTYLNQFNSILKNQTVPTQWQTSNIIKIYKGKGTKGKCSTERGITLASNIGKTFERIINNRTLPQINMTEAQAGGQKGKSTTDHVMILHEILKIPKKNQPIFLTFLDVTKAFDKAWDDAIMYVMDKNGVKHPNWIMMKRLNENLTARINTPYGQTRTININNSIRQGGVLSGTQYSLLMDQINKELLKENMGIELPSTKVKIPALLWMDDVVLISDNENDMQKMLNITHHIANKYHIEFGQEKSETMILRKTRNSPKFTLGTKTLNHTTTYKYLGMTINNKLNISDHINKIRSKTEAAYQTMLQLLHDPNFAAIQLQSAWKLLTTCILPIITYGLEALDLRQKDYNELNKIWENIIKRILKTPTTTPKESLYIETGLVDIKTYIHRNRLRMATRLLKNNSNNIQALKLENLPNGWWKNTYKIMETYQISEVDLNANKSTTNKTIKTKTASVFKETVLEKTKEK
jgi:hypothetical protein